MRFKGLFLALVISLAQIIPTSRAQTPRPPQPRTTEPEPEVVRVDTNLVNTLFTAVDKDGHFITTLRPADVRISENGVVQPVSVFERETNRALSLAFLIDTSESQRGVLSDEKRAAQAFVDTILRPAKDRAAIVSFTGAPRVEQTLTSNVSELRSGIDRVRIELSPENARRLANGLDPLPKDQDPSGYTGIWDAMWETIGKHLAHAPEDSRRAIILLSDGDDTSSEISRQKVVDLAVKHGVAVYSVGIRDESFPMGKLDTGALRKISDRTGGRAFFPRSAVELKQAFAQIEAELRSQYLIAYTPTNAERDGKYRHVRIDIVNPDLLKNKVRLLYREGYYARLKP